MKQKTETKYSFNEYLSTFFPHSKEGDHLERPSDAEELIRRSREKVKEALRVRTSRANQTAEAKPEV